MTMSLRLEEQPAYDPDALLDEVKDRLKLPHDAALARRLGVTPPHISKIRHRHLPVTAMLLISMQEETEMSIRDLRYLCGDFRPYTGKWVHLKPASTATTTTAPELRAATDGGTGVVKKLCIN